MISFQRWTGVFFLLACWFLVKPGFSQEPVNASEPTVTRGEGPKKSLESLKELRVGSYNLLNLFEKNGHIHDQVKALFELVPEGRRPMDEALKKLHHLKSQAQIILDNDFDILAVEEVENLKALSAFNSNFLKNTYDSYLIEGNDPRGIDVGFLVKSSLPLEVEQRSHREETWNDPTQGNKKSRIFSRDLPALIFRATKKAKPVMIFFGTHFKSKRDRPQDTESRILRKAQVDRASEIVKRYESEFGSEVPLFLAGDFNGEIAHEKEFTSLRNAASLTDTFDVVNPPLTDDQRITHSFFPKDGSPKWAQLDAVLVNESAGQYVSKAKVPHYHDKNGEEIPIPKSFEELHKNQPSDHYPVHVELDFQSLVR